MLMAYRVTGHVVRSWTWVATKQSGEVLAGNGLTDGHDVEALLNAFTSPRTEPNKPLAIIATTVKGNGVSFMENNIEWHHSRLSQAQYDAALLELTD